MFDREVNRAAEFIRQYGRGDNCLRMDENELARCVETVRRAEPVLRIRWWRYDGTAWEGHDYLILARVGGLLAFRCEHWDERDDGGWGCDFLAWEVGGCTNPCCQVLLGPDSPSQRIRPEVGHAKFALSVQDAELLGLRKPSRGYVDAPAVRELFGSNVTVV